MKRIITIIAVLSLSLAAVIVQPVSVAAQNQIANNLRQLFSETRPAMVIASIEESPISGLYSVQIAGGQMFYTTATGDYLILGDLYTLQDGGFVNVAEQTRGKERAELMAGIRLEDMIVFSPKDPAETKAVVMVFTDVDCEYCQKLHGEMEDYNLLGIEIRYLAYPRAGLDSESYRKIASVWCADDRHAAMTQLNNRQSTPRNVCVNNPVKAHYELGGELGVTGTPVFVTADGKLMPGYIPALPLAKALGLEVDPVVAAELSSRQIERLKEPRSRGLQ